MAQELPKLGWRLVILIRNDYSSIRYIHFLITEYPTI